MARDNYVGDYGTQIILDTGEDLTQSAVNSVAICIRKPSGACEEWEGSVYDTTKILYETKENDFDEAGTYQMQAKVDASTWKGKGRVASFRVKRTCQ